MWMYDIVGRLRVKKLRLAKAIKLVAAATVRLV